MKLMKSILKNPFEYNGSYDHILYKTKRRMKLKINIIILGKLWNIDEIFGDIWNM